MKAMSEINVTSLLDLCFCLLIIFMISTPLIEATNNQQSIPLNLPSESSKEQAVKQNVKYQEISIDTVGRIWWGQKEVDLADLDRLLENLARQGNSPVVDLRADKSIPYQKVVSVLDKIQAHGLNQISLQTQAQ
jgi:biopolymer transport protein ExbD